MQYLFSVIDDGTGLASPTEEADIDAFNDGLRAEGHWVFAGGLASPETATVIDNRGVEAMFTDGPFVETKEMVVGYAIVQCKTKEEAIELTRRFMAVAGDGRGEIRQLMGPGDGPHH